jgi:RNA polymerase sigma-70 factor (ECF subfamily)
MAPAHLTEFQRLIARARAGDETAQTEILSACRRYLLYIAGNQLDDRLRQKCGPSDIVQNTMLNATAGFRSFQGDTEAALRAWLRQILNHELVTASRHYFTASKRDVRREQANPTEGTHQAADLIDPMLTPASEAIRQEELIALRAAMRQLPADYRQILVLRNWERLSFLEIGERMQKTENAAKKLWARAFMRLEAELRVAHD